MPFDSVTKSGRVRRQVPESGVRSVDVCVCVCVCGGGGGLLT